MGGETKCLKRIVNKKARKSLQTKGKTRKKPEKRGKTKCPKTSIYYHFTSIKNKDNYILNSPNYH